MPRTFAPKPDYAVRFWRERGMTAPRVDTVEALKRKLERIAHEDTHSYTDARAISTKATRLSANHSAAFGRRSTSPSRHLRSYGMRTMFRINGSETGFWVVQRRSITRPTAACLHPAPMISRSARTHVVSPCASRQRPVSPLRPLRFDSLSGPSDSKTALMNSFREFRVTVGESYLCEARRRRTPENGRRLRWMLTPRLRPNYGHGSSPN